MGGLEGLRKVVLVGLLFLVACGGQREELKFRGLKAPQNASQTGYLLDLSQEKYSDQQTETLLQKFETRGGTVRSINPAHGLFEIYGLSEEEVHSLAPLAATERNEFWSKQHLPKSLGMAGVADTYCPQVPTAPKMILKTLPMEKGIQPENPILLKRDGQNLSFAVSFVGASTNYRWEIYGPEASQWNGKKIADTELRITPDELGEYNIFLLVRLPDNHACWRRFMVGVTDNAAYNGPQMTKELPLETKLQQFPHLKALGLADAWKTTQGYGARIAILDTGIDFNHPDLASAIMLNPLENADGKDNDNNKFVDDYVGWDFVNNDNSPYDDEMHGTHVAGLAASLVGVAPKASILAVKVIGPFGGDMGTLAGGIYYAVDRGVRIINMSLGGSMTSQTLNRAIDYANTHGVLIVVAAGNDGQNIDVSPTYPASLPNPNILTVAATDLNGTLTTYSNFGPVGVDVAAPGGSQSDSGLLSTYYHNHLGQRYVRAQGTSMATPIVTGIAALIAAQYPKFRAQEIKDFIIKKGIVKAEYEGRIASKKFVFAGNLFSPTPALPRP